MIIHLQPLGNGGCCGGLWWFCRHSWGYDQRQVRITWKLKTFLLFHISKMHCTYESFRTMLGKVDRLYFPKCTHHLFQKFSFQNAERHEAPSRTKKKVRFSLKFIHHPILKTLICATFEKRHIMEKLDSHLRRKGSRLTDNPLHLILTHMIVIVVRSILSWGYIQACNW